MKLVSYHRDGVPGFGSLAGDTVVEAAALLPEFASLREVIAAGAMDRLAIAEHERRHTVPLSSVVLAPVIPRPGKIVCAGVNYRAHRDEAGREPNATPTTFIRFADSQIGAGARVELPAGVEKFDYEGELAVVIGSPGRRIDPADAFEHIAGYACYNDFSARDWQRHSTQWTAGKNFPGTGAFGPYVATRDEVTDVAALKIETRVNGEVRQSATLADLIFTIPDLIAYISTFTPLAPGDVIVTGTPGGVGMFREPPEFLCDGDVVEVEITSLGVLRNVIVAA